MSKGRLTRNELSWLLTQEAQNAAERLRVGVQVLRTQAPVAAALPGDGGEGHDPSQHVETSLDALDDVMRMLSNLNQRTAITGGRRGRIDLASLLVEVAPHARVSIEPGSGTEVYGDEADFRRMLQVLLGHGSGAGSSVTVRRDGDDVRVSVVLGPDSSPTAETERAWLTRMATRYGGRHELEGASEVVVFPADDAAERSEREALKRELDEARKQGEAYARELAAVFERGEELTGASSFPPPASLAQGARFATITRLSAGIAAELRAVLSPIAKDLASMRRHEATDEQLETLRRRVGHAQDAVASVALVGDLRPDELAAEVDLGSVVGTVKKELSALAQREEVNVAMRAPEDGARRAYVRGGAKVIHALVREVVGHAVAASPRGGTVDVTVLAGDANGATLLVDDAGSALPASSRRAFLALETHGGAYGRPSALPVFMASELATSQGAMLELSDAPSGGLRVTVTFGKG